MPSPRALRRFTPACSLLLLTLAIRPALAACTDTHADEFDFWVGTWEVTTPEGRVAGANTITQDLDNCILREHYTTPSGYEGYSFNIYDTTRGLWHQSWVDNTGLLLQLDGGLVGSAMVMQGPGVDSEGKPLTHRITWTPQPGGTVRQHWETSSDSQQWSTLFDGRYTRVPADA